MLLLSAPIHRARNLVTRARDRKSRSASIYSESYYYAPGGIIPFLVPGQDEVSAHAGASTSASGPLNAFYMPRRFPVYHVGMVSCMIA